MDTQPLVVILAAGEGTHFVPLTINKTVFPLLGVSMIEHTMRMLHAAGLRNMLVITSKSNDAFAQKIVLPDTKIATYCLDKPLGMGYALVKAQAQIPETPLLVVNAVDALEPIVFTDILRLSQGKYGALAGLHMKDHVLAGYFTFEKERPVGIFEKPKSNERPSDYVKLMCDYFSKPQEFIGELQKIDWKRDDSYEQALSTLLKNNKFAFVPYVGGWSKLKYSFQVLDVMQLLLSYIKEPYVSASAFVSEKAIIQGTSYIEDGAKIFEGAVIKDSYIGKNAVVGNHTLVRKSSIEAGATIGFGSEIARSYVGEGCQVHHSFVGDSVLESSCNVSWGTCLTNLRMDDKNVALKLKSERIETNRDKLGAVVAKGVFFGAGTTTLPGVTIGEGVRTYPGTVVHAAIAPHAVVKTYQKQTVE
ncbi:MAG: sugar phosphate nucleotidyltransferase [Candidatus Roizmanbacteria bacterium]|nr:sugar phosphate nucleotidyltransferase [Candidatus Roizmanbacteria bacterium]